MTVMAMPSGNGFDPKHAGQSQEVVHSATEAMSLFVSMLPVRDDNSKRP
jgi:hypothetical protein